MARYPNNNYISNSYPNQPSTSSINLQSQSQPQTQLQTPNETSQTPSTISNILNPNDDEIVNASLTSFPFPLSMLEGVNEETNNLLEEPLVYPFPDSYYALLLAASDSNNEEDYVKDGNLIQPEINDFTPWVDQAPLMISVNSSMELATEMFVRLGTRYLCVVLDGHFVGVIHKKALIKYIKSLK